ncbi:cytochrome P450 [Allokutzneria albata]|uniref:Cytochrome P450 n=1 Tax=Allokutzneria albata TaxID=211114 RepID=A0A1G9UEB8_ALLAB|nr:cytochrome P450 [Allokutzneria albata]SDM58297.1 Cytochrome P450 [Allokutzneria albata]
MDIREDNSLAVAAATDVFAALHEPGVRADPYPLLASLRERSPYPMADGRTVLVGRYADAETILRDGTLTPFQGLDAVDHQRLRRLVGKAFTPRAIAVLAPRITEIIDGVLTAAEERGTLDVAEDLAYPLPVTIISEWLGVPTADSALLRHWSSLLTRTFDFDVTAGERGRIERASAEFDDYFRELIEHRRRQPGEDLLSRLVQVEEQGEALSSRELLSTVGTLLVAGHETTTNLISNGVLALLRNPGEFARLRADPRLSAAVVEETLRYDPPVQLVWRITAEPTVVGEVPVGAGEWVLVLVGAANRDPERYADPDTFRLDRGKPDHLGFSLGPHYCLGASLARLEGSLVFDAVARRLGDAELDPDSLRYRRHVTFRGPERLVVSMRR